MALFLVLPLLLLLLLAPAVHVVGQEPAGFLSIDCGRDSKFGNYTSGFGIVYAPDEPYVDAGENFRVTAEYSQWLQQYQTVRSFPTGLRNCYTLPTVAGAKYLLRVEAYYGNYDGKNGSSLLQFDLHLGANYWTTLRFGNGGGGATHGALFVAWASWAPVCLVNTDQGTPFVSVVELRPIEASLYPPVTASQPMSKYGRSSINMGEDKFIRYPKDTHDRYWWETNTTQTSPQWQWIETSSVIQQDPSFLVPSSVLQTAVTLTANNTVLNVFPVSYFDRNRTFMAFLHFADFQNTQLRQFDIYMNGNKLGPSEKPYTPSYLSASCVYNSNWYTPTDGRLNITLVATAMSVLPPMINAFEIYTPISTDTPTTFPKDFDAIMAIKLEYGVKKNWMGDPCSPNIYKWEGIKCINTSGNNMRITSLDLSKSNLHGAISKNFTLLTALENLDLSYNNLSGSVPDSLPILPSLQFLNLSGNQLTGNSLCKNYTGSLVFRHDSDSHMCNETPSRPRNKIAMIAHISVVAAVLVVVLLLAYFIWRRKRKPTVSTHDFARDQHLQNAPASSIKSQSGLLQNTENRRFTYKELENFTSNFKQFLGQGGFGPVYYGLLGDGTEVAVKMRSESSTHGLEEFLAEVQSLTKVHHRNLVSLVGYCWEKDHLALVYEYMPKGNLCDLLRGKNAVTDTMNWRTRVQILLEASQGLDYLHKGCNLPIIHRDVKSSNILLGQNMKAKIADFGLCKTYHSDTQTHISATAAGTAGYMDPEYYLTGRLTESSDVYSFGVVLLEVTTGEPPIVAGHGHIIQRVKQMVATGDISSVADARLGGAYNDSSMWKVLEIALMCAENSSAQRPTMAAVVAQLKESLALEEGHEDINSWTSLGTDTAALVSSSGPVAR